MGNLIGKLKHFHTCHVVDKGKVPMDIKVSMFVCCNKPPVPRHAIVQVIDTVFILIYVDLEVLGSNIKTSLIVELILCACLRVHFWNTLYGRSQVIEGGRFTFLKSMNRHKEFSLPKIRTSD